LNDSRIIYVGEQHDQFAHHLNQLRVIKKLHEAGYKIAVGMEMFQVPYQKSLDDYMAGLISERRFLKESGYFSNWRFDYNLYKPIIDYRYIFINKCYHLLTCPEGEVSLKARYI
jgi:uncharacterized iron-regulated protein